MPNAEKTKNYFFCIGSGETAIFKSKHFDQAYFWSQFPSKFNSKSLKSPKKDFMTNINFFVTKKKFRTPTAQTIFGLFEEMKAISGRTKIFNGDMFCSDSSEWHFRRHKCRKKTKITFLRWKWRNSPLGRQGEIFEESASHHITTNQQSHAVAPSDQQRDS